MTAQHRNAYEIEATSVADVKRKLCDTSALYALSTFILDRSDCYFGKRFETSLTRGQVFAECSLLIDEVLRLPGDRWPEYAMVPNRVDQALTAEGIE